jgi:D-3-phosphoglycerate dehydrogenase
MRVLVSDPIEPGAVARLRAAGHEVIERPGLQGPALVEALAGCQALLVRSGTKVTAEVLRGAADLRIVVRAGTGLDNVDAAAARERGIQVLNTPAANSVSVAELVFGMLIAFERHLIPAAASLREGRWERAKYAGRELAGRRMGLVGFGRIGREVAARARAFGMTVAAHDPLLASWPADLGVAGPLPLDELLATSDVVSLHVPLTDATRGMIGARELSLVRPDALLVNAARGGLIDDAALEAALREGRLRGALLDVFAAEPPGANPLLALPSVLATPHLGASTDAAQRRAGDEAVTLLLEALAGLGAGR